MFPLLTPHEWSFLPAKVGNISPIVNVDFMTKIMLENINHQVGDKRFLDPSSFIVFSAGKSRADVTVAG